MNKVDKQFNKKDLDLLKSIANKKVDKIVHDEFIYTNTSFGHINLFVDNKIYELKCAINSFEYFGETDDVAVLSFNEVKEKDVKSELVDCKQIEAKINDTLLSIDIINEHQYVKINKEEYSYEYTRGIILHFKDIEYGFQMSSWFSEIIEIYKGHNLIDKFSNDEKFKESFREADITKVTKNIIKV